MPAGVAQQPRKLGGWAIFAVVVGGLATLSMTAFALGPMGTGELETQPRLRSDDARLDDEIRPICAVDREKSGWHARDVSDHRPQEAISMNREES